MSARRLLIAACLVLGVLGAPAARADKLDKDSKKWLDEVAALMLPEEDKTFRALKDKADREEFQRIFWARRNPLGPAATENPFKAEYDKLRADADGRFKVAGTAGSATDCGRVYILLGEPNDVKKEPRGENPGSRQPETWTYKDRPGFNFAGGQIQVPFDAQCQLPQGSGFDSQLKRPAEAKIVSPNIGFRTTADGHLVKLAEQLPKPSPAQALLKDPRQDFAVATQQKLMMRGKEGATYVGGIIRADAASLTVQPEGGKKKAAIVVGAVAMDAGGKLAATSEQETTVEVGADGSVIGSYGLTLKPGKYTLRAGVLDPKTGKGSVSSGEVEIADFGTDELTISDLVILSDIVDRQSQDPKDPLAAFFLGTQQLIPRFGNKFSKADSLQVLALIYNPKLDPDTKKPAISARFSILKGGKPISNSDPQDFDSLGAAAGIGPVPLATLEPGSYGVQIKVTDKVAKKDYTKDATFEVVP